MNSTESISADILLLKEYYESLLHVNKIVNGKFFNKKKMRQKFL